MSSLDPLTAVGRLLETYRGRDKVIRLVSYVSMFMAGDTKTPGQLKWKTVSSEMSACRVVLRLFDDIPMLIFNRSTGFGLKEKGLLQPLEMVIALLNQSYYPIEHLAWLRQKQILSGTSATLSFLGLINWTLSLTGEIIKVFIKLKRLGEQAQRLRKQQELDKDGAGYDSAQNREIKENLKKLAGERQELLLLLVQYSADLTNAISWLPQGFLWGGKFRPATNGAVGIIATLIMLYRMWPSSVKT